jgi:hypothetical protein
VGDASLNENLLTSRARRVLETLLRKAEKAMGNAAASKALLKRGILREAKWIIGLSGAQRIGPEEVQEAYNNVMGKFWALDPERFKRSLEGC